MISNVIRVLANDSARLLQASCLGLGLIGFRRLVHGRALNLDRRQPIELNQRTYRFSSLSKQSRSSMWRARVSLIVASTARRILLSGLCRSLRIEIGKPQSVV